MNWDDTLLQGNAAGGPEIFSGVDAGVYTMRFPGCPGTSEKNAHSTCIIRM